MLLKENFKRLSLKSFHPHSADNIDMSIVFRNSFISPNETFCCSEQDNRSNRQ